MKNRRRITSLLLVGLMLLGMVSGLGGHTHDYEYTGDGPTITVSCKDGDDAYTATICAPEDLTCDGSPKKATVRVLHGTELYAVDPDTLPVTYVTSGGEELDGAPAEPGDYVAQISWGKANAFVEYTLTAPESKDGDAKGEESKGDETKGETKDGAKGGLRSAPIQIGTLEELKKIGADDAYPLNGSYILTANIDGMDAMIGGNKGTFSGTFDGNGYTITLSLSAENWNTALFPMVTGTVKNLKTAGTVTSNSGNAAGIIGEISSTGTIENCWNDATVTGGANVTVGGIVAHTAHNTTIVSNCCNTGTLSYTSGDNLNGIVAYHHGQIVNCFSTNSGIARIRSDDKPGTVTNSYYAGTKGTGDTGTQLSGNAITDTNRYSEWDFENTWIMTDDGPRLRAFLSPVAAVGSTQYYTFGEAMTAWTDGTTLQLEKNVTGIITVSSGTKTLDLNGHVLKASSGRVISVTGGTLNVTDSSPETPHKFSISDNNVAVWDETSGTETVYGGCITGGNSSGIGGGVYVSVGTFNMSGGNIIGNQNSSGNAGGGIGITSGGTVTLSGDTKVLYNYTPDWGGAISNDGGCTLTITDNVEIRYNKGQSGIHQKSTFQLSGNPVIRDNAIISGGSGTGIRIEAPLTIVGELGSKAEIHIASTMDSPIFTDSKNTDYNDASKFKSDDTSKDVYKGSSGQLEIGNPPHVHTADMPGGAVTFQPWLSTTGLPAASDLTEDTGSFYLTADVTIGSTWSVPGTVNLCLNGHGIRMTGTDSVITVASGATLNIYDCDTTTEHKFTVSDPESNGAGLAEVNDALTGTEGTDYQTFTGGYITGGKGKNTNDWSNGGGIYLDANATVVMYGGTIIGNGNNHTHGGALRTLGQGSNFTMYGGSLRNNEGLTGGAFRVSGGSVSIYGGSILYNRVSSDHGAISGDGALVLQDCEIRGNFAQKPSGGVMAAGSVSSVSGNTVIVDNYVGTTPNNLQLATDKVLTITDKLTNTVPIGVTMQTPGVFTSGWKDKMGDNADPSKYFTSDSASYIVGVNPDGQLLLGAPCAVTFSTAHGAAPEAQTVASGAVAAEPDAPTEQGWNFIGWYADAAFATAWDFKTNAVTADTTIYAKWTQLPREETPELTVTQPTAAGGTGTVNTTTAHEYSADNGETWTGCEENQSFPAGSYLIRAKATDTTLASEPQSIMITTFIDGGGEVEFIVDGKTVKSELSIGESTPKVTVANLDLEARSLSEETKQPVTVTMTVESKTEADVPEAEAEAIRDEAPAETTLEFLSITIQKKVGSGDTETMTATTNVLEIVVPYTFKGKTNVAVYRYHGGAAQALKETTDDPGDDGTFRLDEENGFIYIYASEFSTYAIGYTQCYRVSGSVRYGKFSGEVSVLLRTEAGDEVAKYTDTMSNGTLLYSFSSIPQGRYNLIVTWKEKESNVLLIRPVNVHAGKVF